MDLNDKKLVYALTNLRSDTNFTRVKEGLKRQLQKELSAMPIISNDGQLRQAQGRCQILQELLKDIESAANIYSKMMERNNGS